MPQLRAETARPASPNAHLFLGAALAGLIAGTALLAFSLVATVLSGQSPDDLLRTVASTLAPADAYTLEGPMPFVLGLALHYALSVGFALFFAALLGPATPRQATAWGLAYGLGSGVLMRLAVLPAFNPLLALTPRGAFFAGHLLFGLSLGLIPWLGRVRPPPRLRSVPNDAGYVRTGLRLLPPGRARPKAARGQSG